MESLKTIRQTRTINNIMMWAERIQDCKLNYKSVKDWCGANDVNVKRYYYWRRKVFDYLSEIKSDRSGNKPCFVELPDPVEESNTMVNNSECRVATVNFKGISVDIFNNASAEQLTTILGALTNVK